MALKSLNEMDASKILTIIVLVGLNQRYFLKIQYLNLDVNLITTNEYEEHINSIPI
jgi:hypothetical protein